MPYSSYTASYNAFTVATSKTDACATAGAADTDPDENTLNNKPSTMMDLTQR
jgi:hypothetical protein